MLRNILFSKIDNSQIIIFRIFFGILILIECWGAIPTGWVKEVFVDPQITFTFIGFEWTHFLLGQTMYYVYGFLGFLGLLITIGAFYRISSLLFALLWSLTYFMQKEHYNNHYYLVMLVAWFMVFIPANQYKSIDAGLWPQIRSNYTYNWNRLLFITQSFIVYFFAAIAKLYPGWMNGDYLRIRFSRSGLNRGALANIALSKEFVQTFSWLGLGFDLLIVPLLLYKKTRKVAFISALFFHTFNSITLQIGIFPYFALALCVFCFPPETIRKAFFPKKPVYIPVKKELCSQHKRQTAVMFMLFIYVLWQIYLPLRHYSIPGDVLWTEEGHRLSWRMMLRTKSAKTKFIVENKKTHEREVINLLNYLTDLQASTIKDKPDIIWQFAQYLKKEYARKGIDIGVYVKSSLSINEGPYHKYIDNKTDLANTKWNYFGHQPWILPEPDDYSKP
ncbi:HTTM domain-containing protein [Parafilimonas sp.]|uniref:HTTM domain-containing protein n=1 Tax=Parafilimonas sp. TaxID=1969739 RepID=UPI0039E4DDBE